MHSMSFFFYIFSFRNIIWFKSDLSINAVLVYVQYFAGILREIQKVKKTLNDYKNQEKKMYSKMFASWLQRDMWLLFRVSHFNNLSICPVFINLSAEHLHFFFFKISFTKTNKRLGIIFTWDLFIDIFLKGVKFMFR